MGAAPGSINESASTHLTITFSDVEADTHTCQISWGDGSAAVNVAATTATTCVQSHLYKDDPAGATITFTISATVTDGAEVDGGPDLVSTSQTTTVTVNNVPPTVTNPIMFTYNPVMGVVGATASFTDPGVLDTHTAVFAWTVTPATAFTTTGPTITETSGNGSASGSIDLPPGCYSVSRT